MIVNLNQKSLAHLLPLLDMPNVFSYVEPFGGSAAVLVNRYPASLETFNDPEDNVVVFFRCLRESDDMDKLIYNLSKVGPTKHPLKKLKNELEQTKRFYHSTSASVNKDKVSVEDVIERLRRVQIECISPTRCIRDFDTKNTMFYVRPRSDDPRRVRMLARLLRKVDGHVALHAPRTDLLYHLYEDWWRNERSPRDCVWTNYRPISTKSFFS